MEHHEGNAHSTRETTIGNSTHGHAGGWWRGWREASQAHASLRHQCHSGAPYGLVGWRTEPCSWWWSCARQPGVAWWRARHRQEHPGATDGSCAYRQEGALCLRRGECPTDKAPCRTIVAPSGQCRGRRHACLHRDLARTDIPTDTGDTTRSRCHRLHTDHLHRGRGIQSRFALADTRVCRLALALCQVGRSEHPAHRPHHQGGLPGRSQGSGAHRGHRASVRGRPALYVPYPPKHKEPFRKYLRTGHLRDEARRFAPGFQSLRTAPFRQSRGPLGCGHSLSHRGRAPLPHRDSGSGVYRRLRYGTEKHHRF